MEQIILLAIQAVAAILPTLEKLAPDGVAKVIALLEAAIPIAVKLGQDLVVPIENIIERLQNTGALTQEQISTLLAQLDAAEVEFDQVAKDAGVGDGTTH